MQKQIPQNVPSFAPSISFTILAKFETVIFIKTEQKRNEKKKRKEKKEKNITGKQILKSSYITHLTLKTSNVGYAYCNPSVT